MKDINILLQLIDILNDGNVHTYNQCCSILGIDKDSVHRYVKTAKNLGLDICTISNKGYYLYAPCQPLDEAVIRTYLPSGGLSVLKITHSTNQYLIEHAEFLDSGHICVAECQLKGRGRRGRVWISRFGKGLYLSLYWRLDRSSMNIHYLSLLVGIVVKETLQSLGVRNGRLKWPNDLYLDNRKLAGILIEVIKKVNGVVYIVIGVGINLTICKYELVTIQQSWVSLEEIGVSIDRNLLVAKLAFALRQALREFTHEDFSPFFSRWNTLSYF